MPINDNKTDGWFQYRLPVYLTAIHQPLYTTIYWNI